VDVLVLGAGVVGLTTAVTLAEYGHEVVVRTAEMPRMTTSVAAGALWGLYSVAEHDSSRVLNWARQTLAELTALADGEGNGVRLAGGIQASQDEHPPVLDEAELLDDLRPCTPDELPPGYRCGLHYTAPLIAMPRYLDYLVDRLTTAGGILKQDPVESLGEATAYADVVVNCTGMAARQPNLGNDRELYPVRGEVVVADNPGIKEFFAADTGKSSDLTYVIPHGALVVLGGTLESGKSSRARDPAAAERIKDRCAQVFPDLRDAEIRDHRVGLRPNRPAVRLEEESGGSGRLIHNYGHGGAGVSLSWGCAVEVRDLIG
jgi:D-amino-acid oxidase